MRPTAPLALLLSCALLAACGQSGPLVLPDETPPPPAAEPGAEPRDEEEKK